MVWEVVIEERIELRKAIMKDKGWGWKQIPKMMEIMYTSLSNRVHETVGVSDSAVDIVVGVLSRKECHALKCVCEAYPVKCRIIDDDG